MNRMQCLIVALACLAVPAAAHAQVTENNFLVRTAGDLATLCSAQSGDQMMTASVNFCQGYAVGVFQVLREVDDANRTPLFCLPDPPPSRNEAITSFVQWVRASPDRTAQPAADGVAEFLSDQYACHGAGRGSAR